MDFIFKYKYSIERRLNQAPPEIFFADTLGAGVDFCIVLDLYQNSDLLHHSETWRATMLIRSVENETLVKKKNKKNSRIELFSREERKLKGDVLIVLKM